MLKEQIIVDEQRLKVRVRMQVGIMTATRREEQVWERLFHLEAS
jgi:hypothetical protein